MKVIHQGQSKGVVVSVDDATRVRPGEEGQGQTSRSYSRSE